MTIAHSRITAISTSGVRLLAQLRRYGHLADPTEVSVPTEASIDQPRSTGCSDPGPAGFDFSESEARRVLKSQWET